MTEPIRWDLRGQSENFASTISRGIKLTANSKQAQIPVATAGNLPQGSFGDCEKEE